VYKTMALRGVGDFRAIYRVRTTCLRQGLAVRPYKNFQLNQIISIWSFVLHEAFAGEACPAKMSFGGVVRHPGVTLIASDFGEPKLESWNLGLRLAFG
jgi:hypothetical protein